MPDVPKEQWLTSKGRRVDTLDEFFDDEPDLVRAAYYYLSKHAKEHGEWLVGWQLSKEGHMVEAARWLARHFTGLTTVLEEEYGRYGLVRKSNHVSTTNTE